MTSLLVALLTLQQVPDAGVSGITIDFPPAGAKLKGQWTAVSGRLDPTKYQYLAIVGAQLEGFYLPMGHVGVPMVPVVISADGTFVAPRVPLADGPNTLAIVPIGRGGYEQALTIEVTAFDTATPPVTLTASPESGEVPLKLKARATAAGKATAWEWAAALDGKFTKGTDAFEVSVTQPGPTPLIVRAQVDGKWVYGLKTLSFTRPSRLVRETKAVTRPTRLFVAPAPPDESFQRPDPPVRWVLAIDGDAVRVFDATLKPRFVLAGLKAPQSLSVTQSGKIYVADTGHDRIVRFTVEGKLDSTFGDKGALKKLGDVTFTAPRGVFAEPHDTGESSSGRMSVLLGDGRLVDCSDGSCRPSSFSLNSPDAKLLSIDLPAEGQVDSFEAAVQTSQGWFRYDINGGLKPLSQLPRLFACGSSGTSYFVALDERGDLVELLGSQVVRRQKPPFAVTAIAADVGSTVMHRESGRGYGPIHLYFAGKGVLQERVLDPVDPPL